MLGNLAGNLFLGTLLENLFLGTFSWESCLGTSSWERLGEPLGNLLETSWEPLGNLAWEPLWEPLGNLAWEPVAGNLAWEPVPGNLGTLAWDSLGKGGPFLGTWFPTLRGADLAAPTCSGAFTMAEDPQLTLLGKKQLSLTFQLY